MPRPAIYPLLLSLAVLLSTGCDLGTYEARRQVAMTSIANRGLTITIPDKQGAATGVGIMLPKVVGANGVAVGATPGAMDGLALLYEAAGGKGPMVLLGGVPAAEGMEGVVARVAATLQGIAPGVQIQANEEPNLKRFIVAGAQAFNVGGEVQNLPGKTEVLVVTSATHIAIIMFRTTDETSAGFDNAIALSRASLSGLAAPAAAAPPMPMPMPMPMP